MLGGLGFLVFKSSVGGMSWPSGQGWQSFDRQFEPYPRAIKAAPLRCGLDAVQSLEGRTRPKKWVFFFIKPNKWVFFFG